MDRALEAFLIRLDPILLNPLTTNSNQRALGDELRSTGRIGRLLPKKAPLHGHFRRDRFPGPAVESIREAVGSPPGAAPGPRP